MPEVGRYLRWASFAPFAVFATASALVVHAAGRLRASKRCAAPSASGASTTVVALKPRRAKSRRAGERAPRDGAVILAFPPRPVATVDTAKPPALTGSS